MAKPGEKRKKLLVIVGMTGVVYASFKYLLPLVIPFFIAYLIALGLRPSALWFSRHIKVSLGSKTWRLPVGVAGGVELLAVSVLIGWLLFAGINKLCSEIQLLISNMPGMIRWLDVELTGWCRWVEHSLSLRHGFAVGIARDMLRSFGRKSREAAMPFLMLNSMTVLGWCVRALVASVIIFVATILSLQEMDSIRKRKAQSLFSQEFAILTDRLVTAGKAYFKTQGMILVLTAILCTLGLFVIKNPYYLLLGIGIGLLDALPIFGTGTVLIPWGVICFVRGLWFQGCVLIGLYVVCYFMREILEAKMMGGQVGLSGLETLAAMYVGLELFGLPGFLLGPIGLLLIEDGVESLCGSRQDKNVD